MQPKVFKAYDVRGLCPQELDATTMYRIGQALVVETEAKCVVIGQDMRTTSPELVAAAIAGMQSQGANVITIGLTTTPMFYCAVASWKDADAGMMVTASHNPAAYNGCKMVRGDAQPIGKGSGMEAIRDRVMAGEMPVIGTGTTIPRDPREPYRAALARLVSAQDIGPCRVVIDAGNGMANATLPTVQEYAPSVDITPLYFAFDGTFPHHEANPLAEETLKDVQEAVVAHGAQLGVAYDGDADRIGVVDERGKIVPAPIVLCLLTKMLLQLHPGARVLADIRCGRIVQETVEALGGTFGITPVGHAFIKKQLREEQAILAGELSSHFYFADFFGVECSDGVLLLLAALLTKEKKSLSELAAPFLTRVCSGEKNFVVTDVLATLSFLEETYAGSADTVSHLDGLRCDFPDWWFSVRASNTEPVLRLVVEADTTTLLTEKVSLLEEQIKKIGRAT